MGWPKIKVWGSKYPIGDLSIVYNGQEYAMKRSSDDFFEPEGANPGLNVDSLVTVRIQCLDGGEDAKTIETSVVAGGCLCMYQDPACQPCFTDVQC